MNRNRFSFNHNRHARKGNGDIIAKLTKQLDAIQENYDLVKLQKLMDDPTTVKNPSEWQFIEGDVTDLESDLNQIANLGKDLVDTLRDVMTAAQESETND